MAEVIRRGVSTPEATADIEVYAEGVRVMKERSAADQMDPLGWFYQSRMHGNPGARPRAPGEPTDWSQCQHGTWWFLPWHRMYLLQFERIIRVFTGEEGWALPYWDYPNASDVEIPPAFLDSASPLFDNTRTAIPSMVAPDTWRRTGTFAAFGGGARREPAHRGEFPGAVELNPHNPIHGFVGGDMAGFQSPLDPLFWIHHCNIDRLWEAWLALPGRANPDDDVWLDQPFDFPDPEQDRRTLHSSEVATTALAGYSYDDLPAVDDRLMLLAMAPDPRKDDELELIGSTSTRGSVDEPARIGIEPRMAERQTQLLAAADDDAPPSLFLRLENVGIESGDASSMWNVYVGQGDSEDRHLAGTIAPFGLSGLTESGGRQTITFDISEFGRDLLAGEAVDVTYEPANEQVEGRPFWERVGLYTTAE